jgi:hypothetical protein
MNGLRPILTEWLVKLSRNRQLMNVLDAGRDDGHNS